MPSNPYVYLYTYLIKMVCLENAHYGYFYTDARCRNYILYVFLYMPRCPSNEVRKSEMVSCYQEIDNKRTAQNVILFVLQMLHVRLVNYFTAIAVEHLSQYRICGMVLQVQLYN